MKKIVSILFASQMFLFIFYGVFYFSGNAFYENIARITHVEVNFNGNVELFRLFLSITDRHEIEVSRGIMSDEETIISFVSDFDGQRDLELVSGRFPTPYTDEFIANFETGEVEQVGEFRIQGVRGDNGLFFPIDALENHEMNGIFNLYTTTDEVVDALIVELIEAGIHARVSPFLSSLDEGWTNWEAIKFGLGFIEGDFGIAEMWGLLSAVFLLLLVAITYYGVAKLKTVTVFLVHGVSRFRMLKLVNFELLILLCVAAVLSYLISVLYINQVGLIFFLPEISVYFLLISFILIMICLISVNLVIGWNLFRFNYTELLKGKRAYGAAQYLSYGVKFMMMTFSIILFLIVGDQLLALRTRLSHQDIWAVTNYIYRLNHSGIRAAFGNEELEASYYRRMGDFFEYFQNEHGGFIVDADVFISLDDPWSIAWEDLDWGGDPPPIELHPHGKRVTVSLNYFDVNPIETVSGFPIEEEISWEDNVLNIIVPEHFRYNEETLRELYLIYFYDQLIREQRWENEILGLLDSEMSIEDLELNLIYVKSGQCYFSFSPWVREEVGGQVCDPVAVVYTRSIHDSALISLYSHLYFQSEYEKPYEALIAGLGVYDIQSVLSGASSVNLEFEYLLETLRSELTKLFLYIIGLIFANVTVIYGLVAIHFQTKGYELTVKRNFGYSFWNRNRGFIVSLLLYNLIVIGVLSLFLGIYALLIGSVFLALDLGMVILFERRLMNKSFAQIMKGER